MSEQRTFHDWTPDEYERNGRLALAEIRTLIAGVRSRPVSSDASADEVRDVLSREIPVDGEPFELVLQDTMESVVPQLTHWHHPSFHGYFSNSSSGPGVVADLVTSALNVNSMLWSSSPAASAVEEIVLEWIAAMVGYPLDAEGVLVNGASLGTLYALAAAREALDDLSIRTQGMAGRTDLPALRIYTTAQTHSSIEKAAVTLGIGLDNVVRVAHDESLAMMPEALDEALRTDQRAGRRPLAVVATDGTTPTAISDPVPAVADVCRQHGVWLHVDAAYGGLWRLVPRLQDSLPSLAAADSLVVNPHKTLFVPMECGVLLCRRRDALARAFRVVPDYLATDAGDGSVDYMDRSLQLGRSFRALKLWWVIRCFGRTGLVAGLSQLDQIATRLRAAVDAHPDWTRTSSSPLPLVCLRYTPEAGIGLESPTREAHRAVLDELNLRILRDANRSGSTYLSKTTLDDGVSLRVSIGNIQTEDSDIDKLWGLLNSYAEKAASERSGPLE
ncbi:PLP-dependent decarboxylase [Pseudonocardia sp. EV170527-09]|uniref:pyridoxal phosphate-dependent decarboxylase family protein n=1 Tax=Pseudonocardia sp. EV170527-09 TaxID=2603411 RepID=UPI0011F1DF30|nr:pyridoxal-dependent decarboxylase [Pseudonocardia sp. EV170527-09]KAA1018279.1 PLP-dependent decarboxylase [Pseudonocardia sp. EV170527-09]